MATQTSFNKFLSNIEPSNSTVDYISSVQTNLRDYLKSHDIYKKVFIDSFLSGSYAKHTSIRPVKNSSKRDVDIIIVTNHDKSEDSSKVLNELKNVLTESSKYSSAIVQHHSVGVELADISIDVVPAIEDEDDSSLYYICDSKSGDWILSDPKGHKEWSTEINKNKNEKYKPLVKIFKWWRFKNCPTSIKYPKGITLEKIIADNIGDSVLSTEELLIETIQNIITNYKEDYVDKGILPVIEDPSTKIEENDLLEGYLFSSFSAFIKKLEEHSKKLNMSGTDNDVWREILGDEFPKSTSVSPSDSQKRCISASHRLKPMWQIKYGGSVFISLKVLNNVNQVVNYTSDGEPLDKNCKLFFKAVTTLKEPFQVKWQVTNTGFEARSAKCLRGGFEDSNDGRMGRYEQTAYTGCHSVQCFIIRNGACIAKSRDYIINVK